MLLGEMWEASLLVRDEEVVQEPADSRCGDRNGEHEDPGPSQVRGALSGLRDEAHRVKHVGWVAF